MSMNVHGGAPSPSLFAAFRSAVHAGQRPTKLAPPRPVDKNQSPAMFWNQIDRAPAPGCASRVVGQEAWISMPAGRLCLGDHACVVESEATGPIGLSPGPPYPAPPGGEWQDAMSATHMLSAVVTRAGQAANPYCLVPFDVPV